MAGADAAFIDRQGRLSEGSIWNLAVWDGTAVVWPVAEMLGGNHDGHPPPTTGPPRYPPARPRNHSRRPGSYLARRAIIEAEGGAGLLVAHPGRGLMSVRLAR